MSSLDAGIPVRRVISMTTGSISAATPILFINADSTPPVSMMTTVTVPWPVPAKRSTVRPMTLAMPVRVSPSLRMNMAQTAITAPLENPATASWGVTRPVTDSAPRTMSAVTSMRTFSVTNSTSAPPRMIRTRAMSNVTMRSPAESRLRRRQRP